MRIIITATLFFLLLITNTQGQNFYFGNDLSYVNQMEDCGAVFKEQGKAKDVYQIFADHGTNLVRVRLWYQPKWQNSLKQPDGVKSQYNDFPDVAETIRRAKQAGMQVMLDIHLSDFWADPGHQLIPAQWVNVASNTTALADSVYNYVTKVLTDLNNQNLMPEIVKVGNETNGGILQHTILKSDYTVSGNVSSDWGRHAKLYNSAIKAIRDISNLTTIKPKIALHYAGLTGSTDWYQNIINKGVTDFDIIGLSYYYAWHKASITDLGNTIRTLKLKFSGYDVMVVETGYIWSLQNYDAMPNIVTTPDPRYLPVSPEKQLEYMVDYTREVMRAGGNGVIFWEPAWVSTPCTTPWGKGSSHDHLVFFDPVNTNFMENGGGRWTESPYYQNLNTRKLTIRVKIDPVKATKGIFIAGKITGEKIVRMVNEGNSIYSYVTYVAPNDSGAYYVMNDSNLTAKEQVPASCALWNAKDRMYKILQDDVVQSFNWETCTAIAPSGKVNVTFKVDMTDQNVANGVWITGNMTGATWKIIKMTHEGNNIYTATFQVQVGDSGAYYFMNDDVWGKREFVPSMCAKWWGSDRGYKVGTNDTVYAYKWSTCQSLSVNTIIKNTSADEMISIFPNPTTGLISLKIKQSNEPVSVEIRDYSGKIVKQFTNQNIQEDQSYDLSGLPDGFYFVVLQTGINRYFEKVVIVK